MQKALRNSSFVLLTIAAAACAWPGYDSRWQDDARPLDDDELITPTEGEGEGEGEEPAACPAVGGITYERPKPNVMLLVDRSGSMAEPGACAEEPCPSKWQQLLALGGYLSDIKAHARLGLAVFPALGEDGCGVSGGTLVPLSEDANIDDTILGTVMSIGPGGRTPIAAALDELAASGALDDPTRDNIITLLTDGQPNCACETDAVCEREEAIAAVERLNARGVPIRLNVVGFGRSAQAANETLSQMAITAGTARPGPVSHFQAETVEELITRLYEIAAGLAPCRFNLDDIPAPEDLVVHLDDTEVEACTSGECASGYTYDFANGVVQLEGDTCQAIRDGGCHQVWFESR